MTEKKNDCGCGCIPLKQASEKIAKGKSEKLSKTKKEVKESK